MSIKKQIFSAIAAAKISVICDGIAIADTTVSDTNSLDAALRNNNAFDTIEHTIAINPEQAPFIVELNKQLAALTTKVHLVALGMKPKQPGSGYFSFRLGTKEGTLDMLVIVPCVLDQNKGSLAVLVNKAPVNNQQKFQVPFNPGNTSFWEQNLAAIVSKLLTALKPKLATMLALTQNQGNNTVTTTNNETTAAADNWDVEWDPEKIRKAAADGTDSTEEPDILDYEDAYEAFLQSLNDLISDAFGDDSELKLKATVTLGNQPQTKSKVDIITGNKAQDILDTYFPQGDKILRFRKGENDSLIAESESKGHAQPDVYEFTLADDTEATASAHVAIGKWEFFEKVGLSKPKSFIDVGGIRPKNYNDLLKFMGIVCGTTEIKDQAHKWIESQRDEKLPSLQGFNIAINGNAQTPIVMVGNSAVAYALVFTKDAVNIARSVNKKSYPVGRWTWEDRCSRLSCAAVLIYLLRTVSSKITSEYTL